MARRRKAGGVRGLAQARLHPLPPPDCLPSPVYSGPPSAPPSVQVPPAHTWCGHPHIQDALGPLPTRAAPHLCFSLMMAWILHVLGRKRVCPACPLGAQTQSLGASGPRGLNASRCSMNFPLTLEPPSPRKQEDPPTNEPIPMLCCGSARIFFGGGGWLHP